MALRGKNCTNATLQIGMEMPTRSKNIRNSIIYMLIQNAMQDVIPSDAARALPTLECTLQMSFYESIFTVRKRPSSRGEGLDQQFQQSDPRAVHIRNANQALQNTHRPDP
jgi:hypothetical protein